MKYCRVPAVVAAILAAGLGAPAQGPAANARPYMLATDDSIVVRVPVAEEFASEKVYKIDADGYVNLPLVGRWRAAGMTTGQLETEIAGGLKNWYLNPRVAVSIAETHTEPISVLGSVGAPGLQKITGHDTIVEALSRAGGPRADAGPTLTLTRQLAFGRIPLAAAKDDPTGRLSVAELNVAAILSGEEPGGNLVLQPHDAITVSRAPMVYVLGEVNKSGAFVLNGVDEMVTLKAVALAGGLSHNASPGAARVLRRQPGTTSRLEIQLNLSRIMKNKTSDILLQPEDILYVPDNVTKRIAARTIEAAITIGSGLAIFRATN